MGLGHSQATIYPRTLHLEFGIFALCINISQVTDSLDMIKLYQAERQSQLLPCQRQTTFVRLFVGPVKASSFEPQTSTPNTMMESMISSPILDLSAELQIDCFSALGEIDDTLMDAFNMALANKTLYAMIVTPIVEYHCFRTVTLNHKEIDLIVVYTRTTTL